MKIDRYKIHGIGKARSVYSDTTFAYDKGGSTAAERERREEIERDRLDYILNTTTFDAHPPVVLEPRDAADECSHGRLPGDPGPDCGCWQDTARGGRSPEYRAIPVHPCGERGEKVSENGKNGEASRGRAKVLATAEEAGWEPGGDRRLGTDPYLIERNARAIARGVVEMAYAVSLLSESQLDRRRARKLAWRAARMLRDWGDDELLIRLDRATDRDWDDLPMVDIEASELVERTLGWADRLRAEMAIAAAESGAWRLGDRVLRGIERFQKSMRVPPSASAPPRSYPAPDRMRGPSAPARAR